MRSILLALSIGLLFTTVVSAEEYVSETNYRPAAGYVPDAATAIKIAIAVWEPIYGRANIQRKKPFRATLRGGVWHVRGSLPKGYCGGVPEAEISKRDGRVLRVIHGQ